MLLYKMVTVTALIFDDLNPFVFSVDRFGALFESHGVSSPTRCFSALFATVSFGNQIATVIPRSEVLGFLMGSPISIDLLNGNLTVEEIMAIVEDVLPLPLL